MPEIHLINLHLYTFPELLTKVLVDLLTSNVKLGRYISMDDNNIKMFVTDKNAIQVVKRFFETRYQLDIAILYISKWGHEIR